MSTFVIGDVQGCYDELQALLAHIQFDVAKDTLWFTGDLVNRGPKSLEVLRFVRHLPRVICVLGNHDLTLLALAYTKLTLRHHTLDDILNAPDKEDLLNWLRQRPLLYQDDIFNCILVHAGIPPQWHMEAAIRYAQEGEANLSSNHYRDLLNNMFGNQPDRWDNRLTGWERLRFIINGLTRIRFCDKEGNLVFNYKGTIAEVPAHLIPWYRFPLRKLENKKILFGHWAALQGQTDVPYVAALDTGCYWGGALTALRLDDGRSFSISCPAASL